MSAQAEIIGIGKYRRELAPFMEYPESWYNDVPDSPEIVTLIWSGCATSDHSRTLAEAVGTELTDLKSHLIDAKKINWDLIRDELSDYYNEDIERLEIFSKESSFRLFFRPNC